MASCCDLIQQLWCRGSCCFSVAMEVEGRTELRWLTLRLEKTELAICLSRCGQDLGLEVAEIEVPASARRDDECLAHEGHEPPH